MQLHDFDFHLPSENIAIRPAVPRDSAKLLHVDGDAPFANKIVSDLPNLLRAGDILVFNDTKVIPAQLEGRRGEARIGVTLHKRIDLRSWQAFVRNGKRLKPGQQIIFGADVTAHATDKLPDGSFYIRFDGDEPVETLLHRAGTMPLPPYIAAKRNIDERDYDDYQTMFADKEGAVAAPTAALHFTPELMDNLARAGILTATLTLHVGAGTFLPVKVENVADHKMHAEWGVIEPETADKINNVRANGGRVIAVGTTSLRLMESAAGDDGLLHPFSGETDIFITPGYEFKIINGLMTNFHLPKSTLFMLVSALMGRAKMQHIYAHAIKNDYRFYSYGDSSLLLPE
ncbi:tRNA preQ1(34) S-adenosylmethionine ribosyltransferase-isomerase QueA [Sphingorhabdus lutea]|uniref:S-adenosylmethionine:tRNA ribosyltransferase-isomerase n=1 Tax=Sphingorhabdus lutea TaxID=1913578 RepID=A0A1L3JE11_9SPHN|nr:tRNA preQ1(34) S-adenosylmethionine ribosyltransferase-isomerase QueA [Sphingorhabdus lutea]APG63365.1 tRNA preQ1(34) S-adenosylmethionine ribosyltransferase-isomerase QueA [Sphingorhabdus lutea]